MRKHAPALIVTTLFALASGSALAMGDRHKEKKAAPDTTTSTATTPSSASSYSTPGSASPATGSTSGVNASSTVSSNDARCDPSKYASRSAMPKDCADKQAANANPAAKSGGDSGASGSPGSSASSSPGSSSSSSSTK